MLSLGSTTKFLLQSIGYYKLLSATQLSSASQVLPSIISIRCYVLCFSTRGRYAK
ncbi:hypothetical protein GDO81_014435 [Engystomops pustulosus]|uniref:Uncharacterized protein n=1 Tax=Engystomops pustulosus TaxID=76066 RepID=A0AAV7BAC8_ENGPU|nr:hypothetical protein GDO81_014435 [Engystomops pustulosus]